MSDKEIKATAIIEVIDKDSIRVLGREYYIREYLIEMMRREYMRGLMEGRKIEIHVAEVVMGNHDENFK